ncbi:MAG: hypothetical protein OXJ53_20300 [Gammaproteobacteria bacterium]|nr:hypothetical protein [Gammaproteobacteria bacterium]MDE0272890.1 hypothetical protein [Gammaproteobacteria bacterium]
MRTLFALCLALAALALAPHPALGFPRVVERDIVFECPCSAVFTPNNPSEHPQSGRVGERGDGTLEVTLGVRSFRNARSMDVGLRVQHGEFGTRTKDEDEHKAPPLVAPGGVPALSKLFPPGGGTLRPALPPRWFRDGLLFAVLLELQSGQPAEGGGAWAWLDKLALWPVPGVQPNGSIRYVDILTDSDGDGVGDVNEWIAAGWRPGGDAPAPDPAQDPSATPAGPSEVDVLWLHPESWGAESVAEYRHATAVAGHLFSDSGADILLRAAAFVPVPDDKVDSWEGLTPDVDRDWLSAKADEHGADVMHVAFGTSGDGRGGYAGIYGSASGYFSPFDRPSDRVSATSFSSPDGGAVTIAHELGHLFGLAHSAAQGEAHGTFRHSRGHYLNKPGGRQRADYTHGTIMSHGESELTPVFSSPNSELCKPLGPCGLPADHPQGADAVSSLNILRFQIAAVRDPKPSAGNGGAGGPVLRGGFRNADVQAAFEAKLGKPAGDITEGDMQGITELDVTLANSGDGTEVDLAGLERAVKLEKLTLRGEGAGMRLSGLSPIEDLPLLTTLHIRNVRVDEVDDYVALSGLALLRDLEMSRAGVDDARLPGLVQALRGIKGLSQLDLQANAVSNVKPLCGLNHASFDHLGLARNAIRNARPLKCFARLGQLDVSFNDIGTASLLDAVNAMRGLRGLAIGGNPISLGGFLDGLREGFFSPTRVSCKDWVTPDTCNNRRLGLSSLGVSDLTALADFMAGLGEDVKWKITLDENPLHDLEPIAKEGLWLNGGYLSLHRVGLDDGAFDTGGHIARLEGWGVDVANLWPKETEPEPDRARAFADGALAMTVAAQAASPPPASPPPARSWTVPLRSRALRACASSMRRDAASPTFPELSMRPGLSLPTWRRTASPT